MKKKVALLAAGIAGLSWVAHELGRREVLAALEGPPPSQKRVALSVVIPAYNEERYLPLLLRSLQNQTMVPDEVIVADSSTDRTPEIAREFGARVIRTPTWEELGVADGPGAWASGVAEARNRGARIARHDLLLFVDADCIFSHHAMERMLAWLDPKASVVHPRQVLYDHAGAGAVLETWTHNWLCGYYWPTRVQLVRKRDWERVGGFRRMYREDIDFAKRVASLYGGRDSVRFAWDALVGRSSRRERKEGWVSGTWKSHAPR